MSQENLLEGPSSEHKTELNEENFLKELYLFMKSRDTPIERIPHLGFKQSEWRRLQVNMLTHRHKNEHTTTTKFTSIIGQMYHRNTAMSAYSAFTGT